MIPLRNPPIKVFPSPLSVELLLAEYPVVEDICQNGVNCQIPYALKYNVHLLPFLKSEILLRVVYGDKENNLIPACGSERTQKR